MCVKCCFLEEIAYHQKKKFKVRLSFCLEDLSTHLLSLGGVKNGFRRELLDLHGFDSDEESSAETWHRSGLNNRSFFFLLKKKQSSSR